jgi:hypothetical protein
LYEHDPKIAQLFYTEEFRKRGDIYSTFKWDIFVENKTQEYIPL